MTDARLVLFPHSRMLKMQQQWPEIRLFNIQHGMPLFLLSLMQVKSTTGYCTIRSGEGMLAIRHQDLRPRRGEPSVIS